jgi:dynein heavy chain 1
MFQVEKYLAARLEAGLMEWTKVLTGNTEDTIDLSMDTDAPQQQANKPGGDPHIKHFVHELRITNQVMFLHPPLEAARFNIMHDLFNWEAIILSLPRIQHSRYQVGLDIESDLDTTYRNILTKLPGGQIVLEEAYEAIQKLQKEVDDYVDVRTMNFQSHFLKVKATLYSMQPFQG